MKNTHKIYIASFLTVVVLGCGMMTSAVAQTTDMKIGFVDLQRVIDSSGEGQRAQEDIKAKAKELENEAKQMKDDIQALKTDFAGKSDMLTAEAKRQKQDEIGKKERDLSRFVQDSQSELRLIEQRALKQLLEDVGKLVVEYGDANDFTLILEAGSILYGSGSINITEEIISQYNARVQ